MWSISDREEGDEDEACVSICENSNGAFVVDVLHAFGVSDTLHRTPGLRSRRSSKHVFQTELCKGQRLSDSQDRPWTL